MSFYVWPFVYVFPDLVGIFLVKVNIVQGFFHGCFPAGLCFYLIDQVMYFAIQLAVLAVAHQCISLFEVSPYQSFDGTGVGCVEVVPFRAQGL